MRNAMERYLAVAPAPAGHTLFNAASFQLRAFAVSSERHYLTLSTAFFCKSVDNFNIEILSL